MLRGPVAPSGAPLDPLIGARMQRMVRWWVASIEWRKRATGRARAPADSHLSTPFFALLRRLCAIPGKAFAPVEAVPKFAGLGTALDNPITPSFPVNRQFLAGSGFPEYRTVFGDPKIACLQLVPPHAAATLSRAGLYEQCAPSEHRKQSRHRKAQCAGSSNRAAAPWSRQHWHSAQRRCRPVHTTSARCCSYRYVK